MLHLAVSSVKSIFTEALRLIPDFEYLSPPEKGIIVDRSIKSLFEDLMRNFGLKPHKDYIPLDELSSNAPGTDFVVSEKAQEILEGLFEGRIEIVKAHIKTTRNGNVIEVAAYARRIPQQKNVDISINMNL
jgi:hypothetical protein